VAVRLSNALKRSALICPRFCDTLQRAAGLMPEQGP
jgi:hypothetical protein